MGKYQFDDMKTNQKCWSPNCREEIEIDIFLENGEFVALCEVKNLLYANDVKKHQEKRIPKFMEIYPNYVSQKK